MHKKFLRCERLAGRRTLCYDARMAEMSHAEAEVSSQAKQSKDQRPVYEVGFHVVPTVEEAGVAGVVEAIRAELGLGDAEIITEQFPVKMMLAYTIERALSGKREKFSESYFGWVKFATEREHIAALETLLRGDKNILRYLLIQTVREDATPRRAVFTSDRLEGETIQKPTAMPEKGGEVSEEELEKSIEALVS
ncbi:30S ribosomal protein S6 [Patescibacteria group bacterium]|nr:30S ribosomal protein S6 [Patescibacteria group bacterium]